MNFHRYIEKREVIMLDFVELHSQIKYVWIVVPLGQHNATQIVRLTEAITKVFWKKPAMTLPQWRGPAERRVQEVAEEGRYLYGEGKHCLVQQWKHNVKKEK